jgi:preprotein translocase subunit SecE
MIEMQGLSEEERKIVEDADQEILGTTWAKYQRKQRVTMLVIVLCLAAYVGALFYWGVL